MKSEIEPAVSLTTLNNELENYFRNTIIPQLFIDADLILRKFTPPAMKQFHLTEKDIGRPIADIQDNFRFPEIIENIEMVIENNEILEMEIQTTDFRWYQMNIIPYVNYQTKRTNGVIMTFVEITARIKDLKEQEKLLSEYETLLDAVSHDIKNPLASLSLAIELFKKTNPEEKEKINSYLEIAEKAIHSMSDIVNDLTVERKREYQAKAEAELISIENILEDIRLSLAESIIRTKAKIRSEIIVSQIVYSRRRLRSILYNLVSNSIKYSSPDRKPEIMIKTYKENNYVVITVTDNGIGIDKSKQELIFRKYYRVENKIAGTGVGLYLVNELVKNKGGKIEVESEPGVGSTFKVFLKQDGSNG
jgi:two-component system phosphate regulon sensor histidine kinase PhoR